ncbi:MAG TPA: SAM-dependent methyltransferase, partial [Acidimicrobiales bacterium]|nr:SAM-dependent methyltransferase [Acidimicrobiales bacterium]
LQSDRFCVDGFPPRRGGARAAWLASLRDEPRTVVLYEAPTRLAGTLVDLAEVAGDRRAAVCRELTKVHEEVRRGTLAALAAAVAHEPAPRGEVVVVVEGAAPTYADDAEVDEAVAAALAGGATVRDAASTVAAQLGVSRRRAYDVALRHGAAD